MRCSRPFLSVLSALITSAFLAFAPRAKADGTSSPSTPRPHAYAVVVGSNEGGSGQVSLHFAEEDAQRMARVLREIGHFESGDVRVLLHPNAASIVGALDDVA